MLSGSRVSELTSSEVLVELVPNRIDLVGGRLTKYGSAKISKGYLSMEVQTPVK